MTDLKRRLVAGAVAALSIAAASLAPPAQAGPPAPEGIWLAGDLHVHSAWSKDVCETPDKKNTRDPSDPNRACAEPWTWGRTPLQQLQFAQERGLDFLALTDHNTNRHLGDPEVVAYNGPLTVIPGVEFTLNGGEGHANLFGWTAGKPADPTPGDGKYTAQDMETISAQVRAAGGLFSINHPINPAWGLGFPRADAVEVWNLPWTAQVLPVSGTDNSLAVEWWEQNYLGKGRFPAAIGGSDNHWRSTDRVQGVGQPTTWVFARDRSTGAILDAIRAGRTTISSEPPSGGGARLYLDADVDGDGVYETMVGDQVPPWPVKVRIIAHGGTGSILRVLDEDGIVEEYRIASSSAGITMTKAFWPGAWIRAQLFVPDLHADRAEACRTAPVLREGVEDVNDTLTSAASMVIPGAAEVRPINTGPCAVAQMRALTSVIHS